MPFKLNGVDVNNLLYNGSQVNILQINGVTVWSSGPIVNFVPNSVSPTYGYDLQYEIYPTGLWHMYDNQEGTEYDGKWSDIAMKLGTSYQVTIKNAGTEVTPINILNTMATNNGVYVLNTGQSVTFTATPTNLTNQYILITNREDITGRTLVLEMTINNTTSTFRIFA